MATKYKYDKDTDYAALMERAAQRGDNAAAAIYEQQRNAKIRGEGMTDVTQSNDYAQYLPLEDVPDYDDTHRRQAESLLTERDTTGQRARIDQMLDALLGEEFDYDPASDKLYAAYRQQYERQADLASANALGAAAALTGGRASTAAVILVILAAARPQFGSKLREQKSEGIEMMLAVDISNSMLAEDFEPNRLERTKYAINKLFDGLEQDRVGVIVFAGDATVQLPITSDYRMAKAFAKRISPSMASVQGTSIGKALSLAEMSFSSGSGDSRVIILITDGEDHEGNVMQAAERAAEQGIRIFTIGIGTPEGAPIEIGGEFIKDEKGDMVVSKLDEKMLQEIARITGGAYIRATKQSIGLDEIVRAINDMEQSELSTVRFEEYNEQFQYLIAVAFALLLVEFWLLDRRNPLLARFNIFREQRTDIDNYNPYNR